jgi:hypothetical protein
VTKSLGLTDLLVLRDKNTFVEEDTKKRCFVCSIERHVFERHSLGGESQLR